MKRSIETTEQGRIIHTTNGVDTRSAAVYVKVIKPYDQPLANGFNKELADDVVAQIKLTPLLWNQGSWRTDVDIPDEPPMWTTPGYLPDGTGTEGARDLFREQYGKFPVLADLKEALAQYSEPDARCGTAMCFAGWIAELTGANFVIDQVALRKRAGGTRGLGDQDWALRKQLQNLSMDLILITAEEAQEYRKGAGRGVGLLGAYFPPEVLAMLKERGFTTDTHVVVNVSSYAEWKLGLTGGDHRDLFGGDNTFGEIEAILQDYAEFGVVNEDDDDDEYEDDVVDDDESADVSL